MKYKITNECETTAVTKYYDVTITINKKWANYSVWMSFDDNCGETDFGYEKIDSDELTEAEERAVEDYINEREFLK